MSRRAIISDIHSNLVALEAVLADIKTQNVDAIVCLGDICGYGPQPLECIELVRKNAIWTLKGNHDEALFVEPVDFGKNARVAIEWQRSILEPKLDGSMADEERWNWLHGLTSVHKEGNVQFVHASARDPIYEYVLRDDFHDSGLGPTQKAKDIMACVDWLCFCGHSHRPGVVSEDYKWWRPAELENQSTLIRKGVKTIVNVGSVGQPRDGNPQACYVLFDYEEPGDQTKTGVFKPLPEIASNAETVVVHKDNVEVKVEDDESTKTSDELRQVREKLLNLPRVTFRRVDYDIEEAQARFRNIPQLPESNAQRLAKGL
ncbi:MAG TPA: metallophosphoesterase family protein [Planctomycetota bacterium]|nr:metallophosphoesterase family protein [Planctomycetota bacterium]